MKRPVLLAAACAFAFFWINAAIAAERVALVIGNNAYQNGSPLKNCVNDARAVAKALEGAGFEVIKVEDAGLAVMESKVLEFQQKAKGAKAAWFHYAGHGMELKGSNYLVPVDADVKEEFQVKHKTYALEQVMGALDEAKTPLKVVVLDCCRDNPLGRGWSRSGQAGLAQVGGTPAGTIIAYATSPGMVAEDGAGANSPFTSALVKAMAAKDTEIEHVFKQAGKLVLEATGNKQQPWVNSSFFDKFVLVPEDGGGRPPAPQSILVGEFASMSGNIAVFGNSSHDGTLLAIERINDAGGVLGRRLELLTEDDQSRAGQAQAAVGKLISRDGVVAILGGVASSRALEAAPIAQQKGIPMICPAATHPAVTQAGDYIFRVCFTDPLQGSAMAGFAAKTLKARKLAVLGDEKNEYAVSIGKLFKERTLKLGGEIVAELGFSSGDKDFKAQLAAIKASNPDAVFVPCYYPEAALIAIQARQLGLTVPLLGVDGWDSQSLLEVGKEAVEGHYLTGQYSPETASSKNNAFVEAYKKRFDGKIPDAMAALGYDSAYLLADAIRRAGSTEGPALRDALAATTGFQAATGKISINQTRDAVKEVAIFRIEKGKFKFAAMVSP